jgi:SAM-dependent methyltransferase
MKFSFGENWSHYSVSHLDEGGLVRAEHSLRKLLQCDGLQGLSFFDVGCGSGVFSLAGVRLGVDRAVAIDTDEESLAVTRRNVEAFLEPQLRDAVQIRRGDILNPRPEWAGGFDIVYAWGSLHHTGAMWQAVENAAACCAEGGRLVLAIYNHTVLSPVWLRVKQLYHAAPPWMGWAMVAILWATRCTARLVTGKDPFGSERGMSVWYDAVDWLGGLPYEYAPHDRVVHFVMEHGFTWLGGTRTGRSGCNEFVFRKV